MEDEFKEIPLDEIYWPDSTDITEQQPLDDKRCESISPTHKLRCQQSKGHEGDHTRYPWAWTNWEWKNEPKQNE